MRRESETKAVAVQSPFVETPGAAMLFLCFFFLDAIIILFSFLSLIHNSHKDYLSIERNWRFFLVPTVSLLR